MAIFLFTSAELTYRGLCYDSSLLVKFSMAVPKGECRMALLYCTGTKEAIWAAESLCFKQGRQEHINRATNRHTLPLMGKEQQERGRGKLKAWSLVWNKRGGKRRNPSMLIFPWDGLWVVCLGSCWPIPVVCVSQTHCMCIQITSPWSQQNKLTGGLSIWSWSHQL